MQPNKGGKGQGGDVGIVGEYTRKENGKKSKQEEKWVTLHDNARHHHNGDGHYVVTEIDPHPCAPHPTPFI